MSYKKYLVVAVLFLLVMAAGIFFYVQNKRGKITEDNLHYALLKDQSYFAADQYRHTENHELAQKEYEKALTNVSGNLEKGLILYNIALQKEQLGKYADAISQYKSIALNTQFSTRIRAYSVQEMGFMREKYSFSTSTENLLYASIFSGPTFSDLKQNDIDLSYRKLFDYSVSIEPLALSEILISKWYAKELTKIGTTTQDGKIDINLINLALDKEYKDETAILLTVEKDLLPTIYSNKARLLQSLLKLGVEPYTREDVEQTYILAVSSANESNVKAGNFIAIYYASFLQNFYGKSRSDDIENLLKVFSQKNIQNIHPSVISLLINTPGSIYLEDFYEQNIKLGNFNEEYKNFLISLGWNKNVFKSK